MQVFCINNFQALCLTAVSPEAVSIEACAGRDRIEWQDDLDDAIKGWARQEGKARVISMMRPGWVRHAKTRGYREGHREMVCEL